MQVPSHAYTPATNAPFFIDRGSIDRGIDVPDQITDNSPVEDGVIGHDGSAANIETLVAALRNKRRGFVGGSGGFGLDLPFDIDPFDYYSDPANAQTSLDYRLNDPATSIEMISPEEVAALDAELPKSTTDMPLTERRDETDSSDLQSEEGSQEGSDTSSARRGALDIAHSIRSKR